ncbi:MAG: hypothetical protein M3P30_04815 [Chloroflexota bacterium]|nr:hypothetical protein [Chloroflexota bacterium]
MTDPPSAEDYYVTPIEGDFRQGDIYTDTLHLVLSEPGWIVAREFSAKGGRTQLFTHTPDDPPKSPLTWEKERVIAEGQLGMAIVLTHDCEIAHDDSRSHRLVGLVRPLGTLTPTDAAVIVSGAHLGRLYIPAWTSVGLPESYLDLRRITTLREDALPLGNRIASMSDYGRRVLQVAVIRYITELHRTDAGS